MEGDQPEPQVDSNDHPSLYPGAQQQPGTMQQPPEVPQQALGNQQQPDIEQPNEM